MSEYDPITAYEDVIDSRDIIARIEHLEQREYAEALGEADDDELLDSGESDELSSLKALAARGEGVADWSFGATLVRESYFVTHAQELHADINENSASTSWPFNHIDWDAAADELQTDYTEIDFDGITYFVR